MEVNQLGTVLEHDRDDGVLYHLAELNMAQPLEAGSADRPIPRQAGAGVAAVADTGRGLEAVFELDGKYFELITVVKYFGHVKLGDEDRRIGLLVDNKLQTYFLEILSPFAVFKVVADAGEHGVRVADPDEGHLLQVGQVGQVPDIKQRLPAGEGADHGECVN